MATSATTLLNRFSYPKVPGDQPWSIIDVTGPVSYAQIVPGNPPSGGQQLFAQDFGLTTLDFVMAMGSNDGTYTVIVIPVTGKPGLQPLGYSLGNAFDSLLLQWNETNPAPPDEEEEAPPLTDLSGSMVRLLAIGRY